jgi:hypothetical protein
VVQDEGRVVFTLAGLAARWGVNIKSVRGVIDRAQLRPFRIGRRVLVALAEVDRFERGSSKQGRVVRQEEEPHGGTT